MDTNSKPRHIGRNISRIRELRGMKQDALAVAIGVSQQTISSIENSAKVDEDKLELIAKELGVSVEGIAGSIIYCNTKHKKLSLYHDKKVYTTQPKGAHTD